MHFEQAGQDPPYVGMRSVRNDDAIAVSAAADESPYHRRMTAIRNLAAFAVLLVAFEAAAADNDCTPRVHDGWLRLPPMSMPMLAGFGRIDNACAMPATIIKASSPAFASVELHETRTVDGVSRMRAVPELRLPPHGAAVMKPGGLHLMLMRPRAALQAGSRVAVEFTLADGRTLLGEFEVRKLDAR